MSLSDASPSDGPFVLTEHNAGDVLDLYARCIDYFLLQDGEPATLADAIELFRDVPDEKSAVDQTVMGWRGQNGLTAVVAILRDYPSNGVWYLGFMLVDAAARGKGIGRAIYSALCSLMQPPEEKASVGRSMTRSSNGQWIAGRKKYALPCLR